MNKNLAKIITVSTLALGIFVHNNQEVSAAVDSVVRIEGANRFETSALISKEGFEKADVVLIANAREFADALAGVPLAYQKDAPILLAQGNRLNQVIVEEINRLGAKQAIILGGEVAVNRKLENHIKSLGLSTSRIAGQNRFETSELIADELLQSQSSNNAVVVDGFEFADAMSIAPFAAQEGMPIYLTRTSSLSTKDPLKDFDQTYIIGGENAVSKQVESELNNPIRLAGVNRYETNIEVLDYFDIDSNNLFVATGLEFADALTGAVLAANESSGVSLVRRGLHSNLENFFDFQKFTHFTILGGNVAVSNDLSSNLIEYLNSKKSVSSEVIVENEVSYVQIEEENDQLPLGERKLYQKGSKGYDLVTFEISYFYDQETERKEILRETIEPVNEIIYIGTQIIETKEIIKSENIVNFQVIEEEDDTLDAGEIEVIQKGKDGYDEVIYEITYINGVEETRKEISRSTVAPVPELIRVGTIKLNDARQALNGLTVRISNLSYEEGETFDTLTLTYSETNNTDIRIDQDSFKLYLNDGSSQNQYGFFNTLMPGQTFSRTYRFELLKSEEPVILEYGDVFFNNSPNEENAIWEIADIEKTR